MTTAKKKLLTADDLLRLSAEGVRGELILGELCETMPAGGLHGQVAMLTGRLLMNFVMPRRMGTVFGTDAGVVLQNGPDIVREPDVAYYSAAKVTLNQPPSGYFRVVPDLVVEIASPSDSSAQVHDKCQMWVNHGVPLAWQLDPFGRTVNVHRPGLPVETLTENETLDAGEVIPGFTCLVRNLFDV